MSVAPPPPPPPSPAVTNPESGVRVSPWLLTVLGALATAVAVFAGASALRVERMEVRLEALEKAQPSQLETGKALGRLTEQVSQMNKSLDKLLDDRLESRRPTRER